MRLSGRKLFQCYWNLTRIFYSLRSTQWTSTGLGNCLAPNREQTVIWTNCGLVYWRIYSSIGLKGWKGTNSWVYKHLLLLYLDEHVPNQRKSRILHSMDLHIRIYDNFYVHIYSAIKCNFPGIILCFILLNHISQHEAKWISRGQDGDE